MYDFPLKPNLLLGTTLVPAQVSGGVGSVWNDWAAAGRIRDGSDPAAAADHFARWREDVMLLRSLGIQTCRLGADWARIEPEEGSFDEAATAQFKEELMLLIGMGIRPLIVLHQCSDPAWFAKKGGWEKYDNVRCFLIFAEHIIRSVGHLAAEYLTFARPNDYVFNGWLYGTWPPGKKRLSTASAVMSNFCAAHIRAYRLIHDVRRELGFSDSRVSFALDYRTFAPKSRYNPVHRTAAAQMERLYQLLPAEAMLTGVYRAPLRVPGKDRKGTFADFLAVDYGGRATVTHLAPDAAPGAYKDDLGRELSPEGFVSVCAQLYKLRPLQFYLCAGVCDVNDSFRSRFLYQTLRALGTCRLPIKRFYYDSFLDGFHWIDGLYPRTGLVAVDFSTMERSVKHAGEFFSRVIRHGGVSDKLYEKYVAGEEYHR